MKNKIIGIDIGGTTIKIGILKATGSIVCKWEIPTDTSNKGEAIIRDIIHSINRKLQERHIEKAHILGIGIGTPGFIDPTLGIIDEAVNIGWEKVDLAKQVQDQLDLPVFLDNDANMAVLGENWLGSGHQEKNVLAVTLGTGVGGGIIANGEILNGTNGTAGEIGHMLIDPDGLPCNCGRKGCLETIVSATGMVNQAIRMTQQHPKSLLAQHYKETGTITTKDIFELETQGDQVCEEIIVHTTTILGWALANVAAVINPSKILIGGGVSKAGEQLLNRLNQAFASFALPRIQQRCELKLASLGNDAGMIGAAFLVRQHLENAKF